MSITYKVRALERAGLVRVVPGRPDRRRATYALCFAPAPKPAATAASNEEANVPTKTRSKTTATESVELPLPMCAPNWARNGNFLPAGEFEVVDSALLRTVRRRNEAARARLRSARTPEEVRRGLLALADLMEAMVRLIDREAPQLDAACEAAATSARPKTTPRTGQGFGSKITNRGGYSVNEDPEGEKIERRICAEMVELKPRVEAVERDVDRARKLRALIRSDTMRRDGAMVPRMPRAGAPSPRRTEHPGGRAVPRGARRRPGSGPDVTGEHVDEVTGYLPLLAGGGEWMRELSDPDTDRRLWWATSGLEREMLDREWAALGLVLPWLAADSPDPIGAELADLRGLVALGWHRPAPRGGPGPGEDGGAP